MSRLNQAILIGSICLASWLGMQQVHELGHVLEARLTGATIVRVVLNPFMFSRTDLATNPHPLIVVWAGPIVGVTLPTVLWIAATGLQLTGAFVLRFFAGFCLIANGLYIGVGSFERVGDCRDMLQHGAELWHLWVFGILTTPLGLWLWHGQGRYFGLGSAAERVSPRTALCTAVICITLVTLGLMINGTQP